MSRRRDRINVLLRKEISEVLAFQLKDPRLPSIVSITQVETSNDLSHAKIHVSVLGNKEDKRNALVALRSAAGFISRNIRKNLKLRAVPSLDFCLDETMERAAEIRELLREGSPQAQITEKARQ